MAARSYLYVPGDQPGKLDKVLDRGADAVIVDLEDAVASPAKSKARRIVAEWLRTVPPGTEIWVRINAGPLLLQDVHAVAGPSLAGVVVPKVKGAAEMDDVARALDAAEQAVGLPAGSLPVMALIETAAGVLAAPATAGAPRVRLLAAGESDLAAELGITPSPDEREFLPIRMQLVVASAAAGLQPPVGPVSTDFRDLESLRRSTEAIRRSGFGARQAIHPAQVTVINQVFTPTQKEVDEAHQVLAPYGASPDRGATTSQDGRMVDEAVARSARRTLALARERATDAQTDQRR